MKLIIAGSRNFEDYELLKARVEALPFKVTQVISGNARGADQMGEWWAQQNEIELRVYPANWSKYGRAAGHIRNQEMARVGDVLIAFWDGKSKGTESMINYALDKGLEVVVEYINGGSN